MFATSSIWSRDLMSNSMTVLLTWPPEAPVTSAKCASKDFLCHVCRSIYLQRCFGLTIILPLPGWQSLQWAFLPALRRIFLSNCTHWQAYKCNSGHKLNSISLLESLVETSPVPRLPGIKITHATCRDLGEVIWQKLPRANIHLFNSVETDTSG